MTTIPDIKSTYKTWFTWASLTPAQQAFATSQGYSSGSVSVAIGDVVDYVTQTVASTQTLLVDANGDPVCNYGFNGVANIPTETLDVIAGSVELNNISKILDGSGIIGFTALSNGTFTLCTTGDIDLTPVHQNMDMNIYLDPTAFVNYSIGTTTNYVFTTQYSTDSGATWNNWEVGVNVNISPGGPSTGSHYLTLNDYIATSTIPNTVRFRLIVTVTNWNGGNVLGATIRARGIGVIGDHI